MKRFSLAVLIALVLGGCAKSTTKDAFECTAVDGVAPCLTTEEVDVSGPIPKSSTGNANAESVINVKTDSALIPDAFEDKNNSDSNLPFTSKTIEIKRDKTYPIKPIMNEPMRQSGSTERMWFAAWEDTKNDLFVDQQYIYWTEKGRWALLED